MGSPWSKIALVLVFILVGGVFAGTEMALISLRESQLKAMAARSRRGGRVASLALKPNRFLAALQIGVTSAGFLSAALGAATLSDEVRPVLVGWGVSDALAGPIALVGITLIISYFALVLSELAPKRLALQRAESIAMLAAPTVDRFATLVSPIVWLLSRSTDVVVRLLGGDPSAGREQISNEELRVLVIEHEAFGSEERQVIEDLFAAADTQLREVMIPRTEVAFLDASLPVHKAVRIVAALPHSRYPVVRGSADEVVGFIHVRDLFGPDVAARSARVGDLARPVPQLPGTKRVLPALSELRRDGMHLAIVVDEYDTDGQTSRRLRGGDFDVEGLLNLDDFEDEVGFALPEGPYETVAGFVLASLGHIPSVGETVDVAGHRLTVTETDGRRVARLRVAPVADPTLIDQPADDNSEGLPQ